MTINLSVSLGGPILAPTSGPFYGGAAGPMGPGCSAAFPGGLDGCGCDQRLKLMRQLATLEPLLDMLGQMMGWLGGNPAGGSACPVPSPFAPGPSPVHPSPVPAGSAPPSTSSPSAGLSAPSSTPPTLAGPAPQGTGQKSGAPPGYKSMTGRIPPEVTAKAKSLLSQPMGSEHPFEVNGKRYLARLENHYHPPGYQGGPNGWHKGCTVYEAA